MLLFRYNKELKIYVFMFMFFIGNVVLLIIVLCVFMNDMLDIIIELFLC